MKSIQKLHERITDAVFLCHWIQNDALTSKEKTGLGDTKYR